MSNPKYAGMSYSELDALIEEIRTAKCSRIFQTLRESILSILHDEEVMLVDTLVSRLQDDNPPLAEQLPYFEGDVDHAIYLDYNSPDGILKHIEVPYNGYLHHYVCIRSEWFPRKQCSECGYLSAIQKDYCKCGNDEWEEFG